MREPPEAAAVQKQMIGLPRLAGFDCVQCRRWMIAARGAKERSAPKRKRESLREGAAVEGRRRGRSGAVFDQSLKSKLKRSALFKLSRNALFIIVKISKTVF